MTVKPEPDDIKRAVEIDQYFRKSVTHAAERFWGWCPLLYEVKERRLYRALDFDTFGMWAEDVGIGSSTAYLAAQLYRDMVITLGLHDDVIDELKQFVSGFSMDCIRTLGERKWQIIMPAIAKVARHVRMLKRDGDLTSDKLVECQLIVLAKIVEASAKTVQMLIADNEERRMGWQVAYEVSLPASDIRAMPPHEFHRLITGALMDDEMVYIKVYTKPMHN